MTTVSGETFSASPYPGVTVRVAVEIEVPDGCEVVHVTESCILLWFWNRACKKADSPEKLGEYLMIQRPDGTYYDEDKSQEGGRTL